MTDKTTRRALMIARAVGSPERQQAFDQWGGAPERWYHGTSKDVDFPKFKIGRHGAWFARDPQEASKYAEQNDSQGHRYEDGKFVPTNTRSRVIPVHLKLGKSHTGPMPGNFLGAQNYKKAQSEWFDQLRAQGYDSWTPEGQNVAVILKDPTQIKSAIGNRGTYDPNEADIGKAEGGPVDDQLDKIGYRQDNPAVSRGSTEWLASKQRTAYSDPALLRGAVTGYFKDIVHIPVDMLDGVPGANKENPVPGTYKYDELMKDVKKEGWKPDPILVGVNHKGKPHILEGNHRVAVARALGQTHIPGDIRWWNGGEEVDGPWHPKRIAHRLTGAERTKRADGGAVDDDAPTPRPAFTISKRPEQPAVTAFMNEYEEDTHPHPFFPGSRFLNTQTGGDPGGDFAMLDLRAARYEKKPTVHLSSIMALEPGKGQGKQGLKYVTDLADKHGVHLTGYAKQFGNHQSPTLSTAKLKQWYARNGFDVSKVGNMLRPPGGAPAKVAKKAKGGAVAQHHLHYTAQAMRERHAHGGAVENKDVRRALMIARDQRALLRRVANIYPGPAGGMDPSPGGGGYSGPGGGKYIGPSRYADGGEVDHEANKARFLEGSKAPPRLYHGTVEPKDFSVFGVGQPHYAEDEHGEGSQRQGSGPDPTTYLGSHFAEEPEVANKFARGLYGERKGATSGNRVYPVHLAVKNPHVTTEKEMHDWMLRQSLWTPWVEHLLNDDAETQAKYEKSPVYRRLINASALEHEHEADEPTYETAQEMARKLRDHLRAKGHDGIKYQNEVEGGTSWIAFDPRQIKSAIGNRGTYDPNDPDMGKSEGGEVVPLEPGKAAVPKGRVRRFHYTDAKNVPHILKEGIQLSKSTGLRVGDPVAVWSTPDNPYEHSVPHGKALVEFHDASETYTRNPYASPNSVPPENIMAAHMPWHSHYRYALQENLTPEDLRGVQGEEYQQAADALERTKRATGGSVPPFRLHSGAAKIIGAKGQAKATPQQYAAMPGIKPDELKHSKFDTLGSKALPREEVIKHLEDNALPLEETTYTGDDEQSALRRYGEDKTALPGGQNYREVLLHLPHAPKTDTPAARMSYLRDRMEHSNDATAEDMAEFDRLAAAGHHVHQEPQTAYRSSHWDQPNVLAHVRMSDRKGPNGEKVLHVEEVQSDWGQQARERGIRIPGDNARATAINAQMDEVARRADDWTRASELPEYQELARQLNEASTKNPRGVPAGPYVDNTQKWTDLALKRVLHEAAHGGYDKIAFTPGDEQNKRYDLSSQVKNIQYYPDTKYLGATTHDNRGVEHEGVEPDDLSKHIGKEAADRILKQPLQRFEGRGKLGGEFYHELEGEGLKVGGEGMRGYYDNILPKRLQALAQQHDPQAKVNLHAHDLSGAPDPAEVKNRAISMAHNTGDIDDPTEAAWNAADPEVRDWHTEHATAEQARTDFAEGINHAVAPLHSLDVTPQMRDSIKANGFNSFKRGGEVGDDPIKDWQWRPTEDVRNELQLDEIPSHVHKFGEFMDETARRAATQGLTPRDLIKAYAITRSSIGRGALPVATVRRPKNPAYGFDALPEDTQGSLRPEGAMGHWLHTKMGQRYLDEAEAGRVDEEAVRDAIKSMGAFGLPDTAEGKALRWAPKNLPGQEGRVSELIARAHRGQSSPEEWRGEMRVPGIAESKAGFFASMLGRGDQPTLDARQIILNTGQSTKKAAPYLSPKGAKEAAVNRLTGRQTELGLKHDKSMSPFYQHLAHHTIWDKVGNEQTTHDDLMQALRGAKDGGRQGYASGGPTNILGHPVARALITALGPNWVNPLDEAAQAAGMVPGELAHKLRMRVGDKADKLSTLAPQTDWAAHSVKLARAPLEPIRRIDAHEIARNKGTFIAGPGDRQITDAEIHGLNGIEFATPVRGHGGPFYPRGEAGRKGAAWASAQGPVSKQLGMAESAERLGSTPYHVPWSMSRGAVDSTPMMWELIANLLPHAKINKTSRAMIDRSIRSHVIDKEGTRPFRGAPSIASEEFPKWVGAMDLGRRYALMNALEKTSHIVKGFPEPAALRLAITEPEYVAPRSLTAGRVITQIDPKAGIIHDPEVPHPGYPKQFMKKGAVMGFERPAPLGLMFPKAWKTIANDLDPEVAAVPNNVNRAFQMSNIYQPVTNEVADNLAAYFEREKGKPFKKGGGRVGHAPGGIVSRALDIARKINGR